MRDTTIAEAKARGRESLSAAVALRQWGLLVVGSAGLILIMLRAGLPGAWLLGPMVAGIVVGMNGGSIRVSPRLLVGAQAIMGCMVAGLVTRSVLAMFARQWPMFLAVTFSTLLASSAIGWLLHRRRLLPGTTAIWGLSPGASSAMMLMAESHGGDPRLVAFMQYIRVICVAFLASLIARFWIGSTGAIRHEPVYFPALRLIPFVETLAIGGGGVLLARWLKIPSGVLIVPMVGGAILHGAGAVEIELPPWLLLGTFALLGWSVGLQFTRSGLVHAVRSLPTMLVAIAALIAFCGGSALLLHRVAGTELLTAYLATSPGGVDAAAVIAASTDVDLPFVMGLQTVRLIVVLCFGPTLAKFVAARSMIDDVGS
ncbi:AbrB family transcriptional regulator [Singulisphaera sp. PoT]|uniref:AbrB family transcriptional regulator n=1 Tax=Singulisphaera sp. PoT TaxID=3411797 RepID=UPI003BF5C59A